MDKKVLYFITNGSEIDLLEEKERYNTQRENEELSETADLEALREDAIRGRENKKLNKKRKYKENIISEGIQDIFQKYYAVKENEKRVQKVGNVKTMDEIMEDLKSMRKNDIIEIVKEYSNKIKNDRKPIEIALQVSSETGELMDEVRRSEVPGFYKKPGVDGVLGESCDVMIAVLDLLFKKGYTEKDITDTIKKKCEKWYNKMTSKQDDKKEEIPKNENETIAKILNRIIHMNYPRYIHQNLSYSINVTLLDHFKESLKKQIETLDDNEHINVSFPILNRNLFVGDRCIIDFDALTISIVVLNYQIENLDLHKLQNKLQDMYLPLSNLDNSDEKYGDYKKLENVHCLHFENLDKMKESISKYDNIKDFIIDLYPEMTNYIHSIYR